MKITKEEEMRIKKAFIAGYEKGMKVAQREEYEHLRENRDIIDGIDILEVNKRMKILNQIINSKEEVK